MVERSTAKAIGRRLCRIIVAALVATSWFGSATGAELTLVRAGYDGTAGYQLPLWVNREAGFAKKHGIDLENLLIGAGSLH